MLPIVLGQSAVAIGLFACNAVLDNHDRVLDERDTTDARKDAVDSGGDGIAPPPPPSTEDGGSDAPVDARLEYTTVAVDPGSWQPLNGALLGAPDGGGPGLSITGFTSFTHPAIVPKTQPTIVSDDYTVEIVVRAPTLAEFGLMMRFQGDSSSVVWSSAYGGSFRGFIGKMSSTDYNPTLIAQGQTDIPYSANDRFHLRLRVVGDSAYGSFWNAKDAPPATETVLAKIPFTTGRGVGYYVYNTIDAVLESMVVTVP